jgi:hypothetical protein
MNARTRLRLERALRHGAGAVRNSVTNILLGLVVVGLLVVIAFGIASSHANPQTIGLLPLLQAQAISAVSVTVLGLAAWLGFWLRFGAAKSSYLARYRSTGDLQRPLSSTAVFVRGVAEQLLGAEPPRALLVVTESGTFSSELRRVLPTWIMESGLVPVVIDVADCDASARLPVLSRASFVSGLAGASGDEARAQRLFRREVDRGKVIIVVLGLDKVVQAQPRSARRDTVQALLRSGLEERLPFIAAVSAELAPGFSEVAVIRIGARQEHELGPELTTALTRRGIVCHLDLGALAASVLSNGDRASDPWYVEVAADVVVARVRAGAEPDQAVRGVFGARRGAGRELSWMYEKAIGCDPDAARAAHSPIAHTLGAIGLQAHYRQDLTTRWQDLTRELSAEQELQFASSVSLLNRRGVLNVIGDAADPCLQFTHPRWLTLAGAVGLGVDADRWSQLLSPGVPQPTVDALSAALLLARDGSLADRSFLAILSRLKNGEVADLSLDMITAVIRALQVDPSPILVGEQELAALRRTWQPATDEARLLFVDTVDAQPGIACFLWEQLVPPRFAANSYRLRRAVSVRLAAMGHLAWTELAPLWRELVRAARDADLSAAARLTKGDWISCGVPLASLAWVLPSLADRLDGAERAEAVRMLGELGLILTEAAKTPQDTTPDPGVEISLAEGYKLASVVGLSRPSGEDPAWLTEAVALLSRARSWVSEQALHQAIALAAPARSEAVEAAGAGARHPFVEEAVALARRAVQAGARAGDLGGRSRRAVVARDIWFDDVQALEDGGFALSPEAHRLLGLSTLLVNLAEGEHARAAAEHRGGAEAGLTEEVARRVAARERALTAAELPRCFTSRTRTVTMLDLECDCPFRLCGEKGQETIGHRRISRAFAQHAETTAAARPVTRAGAAVTGRQFAEVWRRPQIVSGSLDSQD